MQMRELLFGSELNSQKTDVGLLILRVYSGLALVVWHGWGKLPPSDGFIGMIGGMGMPAPALFAWLATFAEVGGALLLAVGLLTRPAALLLTIHFLFVVFLAHAGDAMGDRETPLFFLTTAILFLFAGGGRFSVDAIMRRSGA